MVAGRGLAAAVDVHVAAWTWIATAAEGHVGAAEEATSDDECPEAAGCGLDDVAEEPVAAVIKHIAADVEELVADVEELVAVGNELVAAMLRPEDQAAGEATGGPIAPDGAASDAVVISWHAAKQCCHGSKWATSCKKADN